MSRVGEEVGLPCMVPATRMMIAPVMMSPELTVSLEPAPTASIAPERGMNACAEIHHTKKSHFICFPSFPHYVPSPALGPCGRSVDNAHCHA